MSAIAAFPKLYVAEEDLKECYRNKSKGLNRLQEYVKSVESSRKMRIDVNLKVEFVFHGTQRSSEEAKQEVQREVCLRSARKKYEKPPVVLPSAAPAGKQQRAQNELPKGKPLTIEALEEHERKETSRSCELRQFGCGICQHSWWRTVLKSKPVSRCRGGARGNTRYDALPRDKEIGIGRFICPNVNCGRRFFKYCEASETLQCRKCGQFAKPYIHPKWEKIHLEKSGHNPEVKPFKPSRCRPTKQPEGSAMSRQPRIPPRQRFNASEPHELDGDTKSTFLSQVDFETESEPGEGVCLDYESDDNDEEKVGVCRFECLGCGNMYILIARKQDTAMCYRCGQVNRPLTWKPPSDRPRSMVQKHSCSRCN